MPQVFDLWQDPQERYDIFMNNFTERTWTLVTDQRRRSRTDEDLRRVPAAQAAERGLHRPDHHLTQYERFKFVRDALDNEGFTLPMPSGN